MILHTSETPECKTRKEACLDEKETLLSLLKHEQEIHRRWKQGQATWNKHREVFKVEIRQEKQGLIWN